MSTNFLHLPILEKLSETLSIRRYDELDIVVIDHPKVKAALALQGAHLLRWQPENEKPVIWLSDKSFFKQGQAIRGGVPICWPWFGKVAQPAHGFARNLPWQLTAYHEDEQDVILTFTLTNNAETLKYWPHEFTLLARYKLGKECEIELESFGDYQATAALHTYFEISDIEHIKVSGLGGNYHDKIANTVITHEEASLTFNAVVDRVYTAPRTSSIIHDKKWHRDIDITHHQHSDVVAWNPFDEVSKGIVDMSESGYKTMVCVETARVSKPLLATEKTSARLGVTIQVKQQ